MATLSIYGRPSTGGLSTARSGDTLIGSIFQSHASTPMVINSTLTNLALQVGGVSYLTIAAAAVAVAGGSKFSGDGSLLTSLNAAQLTQAPVGTIQGGSTSLLAASSTYFCTAIGGTASTGDRVLYVAPNAKTFKNFSFLAAVSAGSVTFTVRLFNGSVWSDTVITGTVTSGSPFVVDTTHTLSLLPLNAIGVKFVTNGSVPAAITEIEVNGEVYNT